MLLFRGAVHTRRKRRRHESYQVPLVMSQQAMLQEHKAVCSGTARIARNSAKVKSLSGKGPLSQTREVDFQSNIFKNLLILNTILCIKKNPIEI